MTVLVQASLFSFLANFASHNKAMINNSFYLFFAKASATRHYEIHY
ncbi:hypothetical protein RNAN_1513 [Rheinheimera nanhaiensis E407-8]|uniref:Uncharacterized protein n=1 Tax=Rheinheimera nanhaiensis E407-8 TaxID=562729 RepID=I1DWW2_9GAMM|nr:hypothetical protein RNAN_1513 [Rheinheimera nanhaiensis E407-8]